MDEDKIMQIIAKMLSDIGEIKNNIIEIEYSQAEIEQRLNKLEGSSYISPQQLEDLKKYQTNTSKQKSIEQSKSELLDMLKNFPKEK